MLSQPSCFWGSLATRNGKLYKRDCWKNRGGESRILILPVALSSHAGSCHIEVCFVEKTGGEKQAEKKAMEETFFHVQYVAFPLHPSVLVRRRKQKNLLGRGGKPRSFFFTVSNNRTTMLGKSLQLMRFFQSCDQWGWVLSASQCQAVLWPSTFCSQESLADRADVWLLPSLVGPCILLLSMYNQGWVTKWSSCFTATKGGPTPRTSYCSFSVYSLWSVEEGVWQSSPCCSWQALQKPPPKEEKSRVGEGNLPSAGGEDCFQISAVPCTSEV